MRTALVLLITVALAFAGCIGGTQETPVEAATTDGNKSVQITDDRPDPTFSDIQAGQPAPRDLNATLDAAPKLVVGEYWRIKLSSPLTGDEAEFIRVVADIDGDAYVIGMPHEGWYKEAVVYHVPFFGDVNTDLSGRAHNIPFHPLKFPLTDGATWETNFETADTLVATVSVTSPSTADIVFTNENDQPEIELTYDATMHEITRFAHSTVHYEVLEHGYDFQGWVTVPRGEELIFMHGRVAGAAWIDQANPLGLGPAPSPLESVEVNGGFNRMSFILVAGSITPAPGYFSEKATAPDGTAYELTATGPMVIEFFEARDPDGVWNLEHIAGGAGLVFIEGIAYHQYDIKVPTGEKRSDHSHEVIR